MMKRYVILGSDNMVQSAGFSSNGWMPEGAIEIDLVIQSDDAACLYWDGEGLAMRPSAPQIERVDEGVYRVVQCPTNTRIVISDLEDGERLVDSVFEGDVNFNLTDPGGYQIEITPPLPYLCYVGVLHVGH